MINEFYRYDSDTDLDELSDGELAKLVIVTQTPGRPKKHEGFDRTGDFVSRAKMSSELAKIINDGLIYYEGGSVVNRSTEADSADSEEDTSSEGGWVGLRLRCNHADCDVID